MTFYFIEVISYIFTIDSDYDYYVSGYSQPRHINPYIGLVAQVCRRWHTITKWKANPHFWVTRLHLELYSYKETDNMSRHSHLVHTVTHFRHALSTVEDSEITLHWDHDRAEKMILADRIAWSRIFMHCVAMLSEYSRQLTEVNLRYLNDYEYGFAKAFLSGLESPYRLQTLDIASCGATASTEMTINFNDL